MSESRRTHSVVVCFVVLTSFYIAPPIGLAAYTPTQYAAQWRDGSATPAAEINGWVKQKEGSGQGAATSFKNASIAGRRLFDRKNPVHFVRAVGRTSALNGPAIEMANGDVLPGRMVGVDDIGARPVTYALVAVSSPLYVRNENHIVRVRIDAIARMMMSKPSGRPLTPGLVVFADGREVVAKALKWTPKGLQLLLDRSAAVAAWEELAEVHALEANRAATILRDTQSEKSSDIELLGRMTTASGGIFTCHCDRVVCSKVAWDYYHVVQPAWTRDGVFVHVDNIVSVGYRDIDEVPLSLVDGTALAERDLSGFTWRWRPNRSVHGTPLAVGNRSAELGIGTHSYSEVAFEVPPGSMSFSSWVGIDNVVGRGGCVRCKVFLDDVIGDAAWASGLLRGGDEPIRAELTDLKNAKRIILVTEFADADHPPHADPLDIGDAVSWLSAAIRIDVSQRVQKAAGLSDRCPPLRGWSIDETSRRRITTRRQFIASSGRWGYSIALDMENANKGPVKPLVLSRRVDVTLDNAWFQVGAARDTFGTEGYQISVHADGKKVPGTEGYDGGTFRAPGRFDPVPYALGKYVGQTIELTVTATPAADDASDLSGIIWGELSFAPLIDGLPSSGKPIEPDVALESISTLRMRKKGDDELEKADALFGKRPLCLRFCPMATGLDVPSSVEEVTCRLKPQWKRFVACIGPAGLSTGNVHSFQVLIDGEIVWQGGTFTRFSPAQQISVALPPERAAETLTLRVDNESNVRAVWANAGFMVK